MSGDQEMDDIVEEFLAESGELLVVVEGVLVAAEHGAPPDADIAAVFRALHTVKGTAAFLGYPHITALAHDAEHLLTKIRDHELLLDEPRVNVLIATVDALRTMLAEVEANGSDGEDLWDDLLRQLTSLSSPAAKSATVLPTVETADELVAGEDNTRNAVEPDEPEVVLVEADAGTDISGHVAITAMADLGVPLGAHSPCQTPTWKSLRPDSCTVGRSGSDLTRVELVTA